MKLSISYIFFLFVASVFTPSSGELADAYINTYKDIAISEMHRTGIPASIKLAQGLLESDWGRSDLARSANNHFGIKCASDWTGGTYYKHDDDRNAQGELIKSCFRGYDNPSESYIAHSEFLVNRSRYSSLFNYDRTDYRNWAHGLREKGYATDKKYPTKLIMIIEKYELHRFDHMGAPQQEVIAQTTPTAEQNSIDNATASTGMQVENTAPQSPIENTEVVEEKTKRQSRVGESKRRRTKRKIDRDRMYHHVKEGDSMKDIARMYRIELDMLYAKNRMPKGSEPLIGELIKLKGISRTDRRPKFIRFPMEGLQDEVFLND